MIEDDELRLAFLDPDVFGEEVEVQPDSGPAFDPKPLVIFDAKPVDTRSFENRFADRQGARPSGSSPRLTARASDFPKSLIGKATVTIRGIEHSIFDIEHDGTGWACVTVKRK